MSSRPNYNTPSHLAKLGVAANLGTILLPRGFCSYRDKETKKYFLRVAYVLPASKAIALPGDNPKWQHGASQQLMGMMLGQDRSTTNRDLRMFCGEDALVKDFFNKWRPGIGCVNRYSNIAAPDDPAPTKKTALLQHDPAELARRFGEECFDRELAGLSGAGRVALWTFDENMPLPVRCGCRKGQMKFNFSSNCMKCGGKGYTLDPERKLGPSARIILTVLQLKGIVEFGKLDMTCAELGDLCGLCERTVAEHLDELEDLKILQIVPGKVYYDKAGNVAKRDAQRIIWLPGLLLDDNLVAKENDRFAVVLKHTLELAKLNGWSNAEIHLARIAALHQELLRRWLLSRHSMGAFWNAMRKLIYTEGLPCGRHTKGRSLGDWVPDYRAYLFPFHLQE